MITGKVVWATACCFWSFRLLSKRKFWAYFFEATKAVFAKSRQIGFDETATKTDCNVKDWNRP
jgi:hypothetical protein